MPESDPTTCRAGPQNGPMDRPRNKVTRGFYFLGGKIYINHLVFQLPTIPIFPGDDDYDDMIFVSLFNETSTPCSYFEKNS